MPSVKLKHVHRFKDRHGRVRHYLRLPGQKAKPLPGAPGSPQFMAAYAEGLAQLPTAQRNAARQVLPGSFDALVMSFYASDAFTGLKPSTQRARRNILEAMRAKHGEKPWRMLDAEGVRRILSEKTGTPTAANHRLGLLRQLAQHAIASGLRRDDPTLGVKRHRYDPGDGFLPWPEELVARYRAHWPEDTVQRRAFELMREGGLRRSDAVRLGRQHRQGGVYVIRQEKTGGEAVVVPSPLLARVLEHTPAGHLLFCALPNGKQRSPRGFYNSFMAWCRDAGIPPGYGPHGLRKALGNELAEEGASEWEVSGALGHSDPKSSRPYTKRARLRVLAEGAQAKRRKPA